MRETAIERFGNTDMAWLQFVVASRKGEGRLDGIDMHIGSVADDNVYRSIRLFETGVLDAEETVKRLKTEPLHDQWTFHTDKMLSYLTFMESKEIHEEVCVWDRNNSPPFCPTTVFCLESYKVYKSMTDKQVLE